MSGHDGHGLHKTLVRGPAGDPLVMDANVNAVLACGASPYLLLDQRLVFVSRAPLLQALIGLFELPEDDSIPDDEHFIDIEDTPGYQTAFSQLAFAGRKEHDPIGEAVGNPKILLAQSLHKLSTACPGRVRPASLKLKEDFTKPKRPFIVPE